jgi:hypothetical protein
MIIVEIEKTDLLLVTEYLPLVEPFFYNNSG